MPNISVDPRSFELAEYFLAEPRAAHSRTMSLAQAIQQAVEDWFEENGGVERA